MKRRFMFFMILLIAGSGFLSRQGIAESSNKPEKCGNTLKELKAKGKLIVGVPAHEAPFGFTDEKGDLKGIDVDIADALAKEIWGKEGKVEFVKVAVETMLDFLKSGKIDILLAPLFITREREKAVDFSIPYFVSGYLVMVERNSKISSYEDLGGKTLAMIQGTRGAKILPELIPTAKPVLFRQNGQALQALKEHKVDAFVQLDVFLFYLEAKDKDLRVVGLKSMAPSPMGLAVRKGDQEWVDYIDIILLRMIAGGQYRRLLEKWFGTIRGGFLDLALRKEIQLKQQGEIGREEKHNPR